MTRLAGGLDAEADEEKTKSRIETESGVFGSRNQLGDGAIEMGGLEEEQIWGES